MKKLFLLLPFIVSTVTQVGAQEIPIGTWEEALPYNTAQGVTQSDLKIYCATSYSVFSVSKSDMSLERFSKVNGLSDISPSAIGYSTAQKKLVIAYANSNIDVMTDSGIVNISDIKRKNIIGDKRIYSIFFNSDYAYLCCGFGIVVLDLGKMEIKDTYYIGPNGASIKVNAIATDGSFLYAATEVGLLRGSITDPNLANYNNWFTYSSVEGLAASEIKDVVSWQGSIYAANDDSVFKLAGGNWNLFYTRPGNSIQCLGAGAHDLYVGHITAARLNIIHDTGGIDSIPGGYYLGYPMQVIEEGSTIWLADAYHGLLQIVNDNPSFIHPDGPQSKNVFDLAVNGSNHSLYVAPGGYSGSFLFLFIRDGFYTRINGVWGQQAYYLNPIMIDSFDIDCVTIDPQNNRAYFGSFWNGMLEWDDQLGITNQWTDTNSTLEGTNGDIARVKATAIAFDSNNNMWVSNFGALDPIVVRKADGTWLHFKPTVELDQQRISQIDFDQFGHVWFVLPRKGVMVYDPGTNLDSPDDDQYKLLTLGPGTGNLPSTYVNCLDVDDDGNVWVGTAEGLAIFYCPGDVFTDQSCDAQQIVITAADGYNGYLLGTENVKKIITDGANRKWVATDNGLWLFSADGTQQLEHFTAENSPLFSNSINALALDHDNGNLYIGTDYGLNIYRSDATINTTNDCAPFVFPNPVRENYQGSIAIKNVANNAEIKITDVAGNLIYRTTANGGEAIWDGNDYSGNRAKTGVYLVFASNSDGTSKCVTKLLVVNGQ